ncbi:MAG: hypothetical protein HZB65_01945 [Candidatus Aenigmarchaeota archaeon]|nr:hypothetical protein [Candidatus Aenigmarchaeota archaeon]
MIHWFVFNIVVMLVSGLILLERFFGAQFDFLPTLAGILFVITLLLFIKDVMTLRG